VLEELSDLPSIAGRPEATAKVSDPAAPMNEDGKFIAPVNIINDLGMVQIGSQITNGSKTRIKFLEKQKQV